MAGARFAWGFPDSVVDKQHCQLALLLIVRGQRADVLSDPACGVTLEEAQIGGARRSLLGLEGVLGARLGGPMAIQRHERVDLPLGGREQRVRRRYGDPCRSSVDPSRSTRSVKSGWWHEGCRCPRARGAGAEYREHSAPSPTSDPGHQRTRPRTEAAVLRPRRDLVPAPRDQSIGRWH